jgi:hypothetical protein
MPHRILQYAISNFPVNVTSLVEGTMLSILAIWKGTATIISDDAWEKLTGPHGLVFALIIGIIIIWSKSVRDDAARERRHKETIKTQQEHFQKLIDLNEKTANDLKILTVASTKAQMSATNAIISMDHNIIRLTNELSDQARISVRRKAKKAAAREAREAAETES